MVRVIRRGLVRMKTEVSPSSRKRVPPLWHRYGPRHPGRATCSRPDRAIPQLEPRGTRCRGCRSPRSIGSSWYETSVEEGVVDRLTVRQEHHAQVSAVHLWHLNPAPYAPVSLRDLADRRLHGPFDPFVQNHGSIGAVTNRLEVRRAFHVITVPELPRASKPGTWPAPAWMRFGLRSRAPRNARRPG